MDSDRLQRRIVHTALGLVVVYHLALLFVEVRHPEPFLNDNVLHFGLIRAMASAQGRGQSLLDPWVPTWALGFPAFHYYQCLPHLLVLGLWKLSFGTLSLLTVFKGVQWLAIGTLPIPTYLAMRKLGFSRTAAALSGTLALSIKTDYLHGLDFESYVWQGLGQFTQAVGGWMLPLAIAWTYTALRDGRGYAKAATLSTATLLSHFPLGTMGFMAASLAAVLSPRRIAIRLPRLALIIIIAGAATLWTVLPIFRDFAYYNLSTLVPSWKYHSFGHEIVLARLIRGEIFDYGRFPILTLLVGAGLVFGVFRARRDESVRFLLTIFVFFVLLYFGRPTWGGLLNLLPLGSGFHYSRAVYLVHASGVMLPGVALAALLDRISLRRLRWAVVLAIIAAATAPSIVERTKYLLRSASLVREAAASYERERPDLERALALAREDRMGRVYAGQGRPGSTHPWGGGFMVGWTPVYSWLPLHEMDALGYLHHMWSLNADMHDAFDERNPAHYRVFNVRRIVAPPEATMPSFATEIARFGRFRVLRVDGGGFLELVDAPYTINVSKRKLSQVQREWLASELPGLGFFPVIRLAEEGPPIPNGVDGDRFDVEFPKTQPFASLPGEILQAHRHGEDFSAELRVDRPAYLLLKMSFHPGWRAKVDGRPAETVHLLPSFVGVALERGRHEVELTYDPGGSRTILALMGALVLVVFHVAERRIPF